MRSTLLLTALISAVSITPAVATPVAFPQGKGSGADSCPSDDLTPKTWTDLKIDNVLASAAKNVSKTEKNSVQALADSFGAPNFFCGLDSFCNAGQPCLPVKIPDWYALVAIQNWNNYMNSLNSAVGFATSIMSLKLPQIVSDLYPKPDDNITPLKNVITLVSGILSVVPLTGAVAVTKSAITSGLGFINTQLTAPPAADKFLAWSDIATSMADVVQEYQGAVSDSVTRTLDAPVDDPTHGINEVLKGGSFLGVSQNFTQTDIQSAIADSLTLAAIGMVLQAQKWFVFQERNRPGCDDGGLVDIFCETTGSNFSQYLLLQRAKDDEVSDLTDQTNVLINKYGMTKEQIMKGPVDCFNANKQQQLVSAFSQGVPVDPKQPCVYNILVCDTDDAVGGIGSSDILTYCTQVKGLDI